jgi:hypothetical protein
MGPWTLSTQPWPTSYILGNIVEKKRNGKCHEHGYSLDNVRKHLWPNPHNHYQLLQRPCLLAISSLFNCYITATCYKGHFYRPRLPVYAFLMKSPSVPEWSVQPSLQEQTIVTSPTGTNQANTDGVKPRPKAHRLKRYDPLVEARVMNQLQKRKNGLTLEQLQNTLKTSQAEILAVLELYRNEGHVTRSKSGVWTLVREEAETPKPS